MIKNSKDHFKLCEENFNFKMKIKMKQDKVTNKYGAHEEPKSEKKAQIFSSRYPRSNNVSIFPEH